jgi:hypothetical protein
MAETVYGTEDCTAVMSEKVRDSQQKSIFRRTFFGGEGRTGGEGGE